MNFSQAHFLNELNKSKAVINESLNESADPVNEVAGIKLMPYAKARKLTKKLPPGLAEQLADLTETIQTMLNVGEKDAIQYIATVATYGNAHPGQWMDESVNEASQYIDLTVDSPYDIKKEKQAAKKIKITTDPITITKVIGEINEEETNVDIHLSNGDFLSYYNTRMTKAFDIKTAGKNSVPITFGPQTIQNHMEGSGTIVQGMMQVYKSWKTGKISGAFE